MSSLDASHLKDPLDAIRAALLDGSKTPVQCDVCLSQSCDGVRAAIVFPGDYKRKTLAIAMLRKEISDAQNKLDKLAHVDWLGYQRGIGSARETARRYFRRKAIDDQRLRQGRYDFGCYWSERLKAGSFVLRHLELLESREYSDCNCEGERLMPTQTLCPACSQIRACRHAVSSTQPAIRSEMEDVLTTGMNSPGATRPRVG